MFNRFTYIINKLSSLGVVIPQAQRIQKLLDILPDSQKSKFNVIMKAKDIEIMTTEELMGNLKTYEMKKFQIQKNTPTSRYVNLVLNRGGSSRPKPDNNNQEGCYRCGSSDYFIRDCPKKKENWKKGILTKKRREQVPKDIITTGQVDQIVKKALPTMGKSSRNDEENEKEERNKSLLAKKKF